MKHILTLLLLLLNTIYALGQRTDTFDVYFERNDAKVQLQSHASISKLIADSSLVRGQKITLLGYADYLGSSGHNDSLSLARAKSVEDYLLQLGFRKKDISLCVGKGKIDRAPVGKDGYSADRKVQVITTKKAKANPFNLHIEMIKVTGKGVNFAIGKYHITQAQWQAVMGRNPSTFKGCDSCPVETVSLSSILVFLQKLDSITGKQYRLPTEAEWEYAATGGSKGHNYYFSGSNDLNEVGWYGSNSSNKTHPVGQKKPNELGIYDMTGNVWQWCHNPSDSAKHPFVIRGGAYFLPPRCCRITYHCFEFPVKGNDADGFRVAYSL